MAIDEPLPLVSWVHGHPAVLHSLFISPPLLHEPPDWPPLHWDRGFVGSKADLAPDVDCVVLGIKQEVSHSRALILESPFEDEVKDCMLAATYNPRFT